MFLHKRGSQICKRSRGIATVCLIILALVVGITAMGVAVADDDNQPPTLPASYYGEVTIDGEAAPEGITVQAVINGDVYDELITNDAGTFGGPQASDNKLIVEPPSDESTDQVHFYILDNDGERYVADQTLTWEEGDLRSVDLTASTDSSTNERSDGIDDDDDASTDEPTTERPQTETTTTEATETESGAETEIETENEPVTEPVTTENLTEETETGDAATTPSEGIDTTEETGDNVPGFGMVSVFFALIVALLVSHYRRL